MTKKSRPLSQHRKIALPEIGKTTIADINDIEYLESQRSATRFYFSNKTRITLSRHLGYFEEQLSGHNFCRVKRQYLVNLEKVTEIRKGEIVLKSGVVLSVSQKGLPAMKARMKAFVIF